MSQFREGLGLYWKQTVVQQHISKEICTVTVVFTLFCPKRFICTGKVLLIYVRDLKINHEKQKFIDKSQDISCNLCNLCTNYIKAVLSYRLAVPQLRELVVGFPMWRSGIEPRKLIWDLWWKKRHRGKCPPRASGFPASHSIDFSRLTIIRGWYTRPDSDRRTKWTQSHPAKKKH
jgi:hypothetical protein